VRSPAEVALSLGVVALGLGVAGVTATLPSEGGYAGIGPNFIPAVVAAGIIAVGVWLGSSSPARCCSPAWRAVSAAAVPRAISPSPW
jgi:hypothetical protein